MATVRSHGLHGPSALPFLVAEDLLTPNPSEYQYVWKTTVDESAQPPVDDEIIWTKTCVVWSRGGVVKTVFRLDLEKEEVRHALFTYFAPGNLRRSDRDCRHVGEQSRMSGESRKGRTAESSHGLTFNGHEDPQTAEQPSRALVVVLKSQAHIFFLSGNSHVIPLPFEVHSVFATPRGLLFQRKLHEENHKPYPAAPPSSFVSSFHASADFRSSQTSTGRGRQPSLGLSSAGLKPKPSQHADLPRVFSLIDPHSEMGLVVSNQNSRYVHDSGRISGFDPLDPADEIVYVSTRDELSQSSLTLSDAPLILVVTVNTNTSFYTIWAARYRDDDGRLSLKKRRKRDTGGTRSKRRSSHFGMGTGSTTPAGRPVAGRESFGHRGDGWNVPSLSNSQIEGRPDEEEDLASKIGDDFGDIGVPSKASRRVSSLLARADLASSQDRIAFSDLATGSQSSSMVHGGARQSMGATSNNRGSFGFNPRASATSSVRSTAGNFLDAPVDRLLEELNNVGLFEGFENMELRGSASGLPEEIMLSKVESFSLKFSGGFHTPVKPKGARNLRISTLSPSGGGSIQNKNSETVAVCVVDRDSKSMALVNLRADKVSLPQGEKIASRRVKSGVTPKKHSLLVHATGIQHYEGVWDSCKIVDGDLSRFITVGRTGSGQRELSLLSPWSVPVKIEVPVKLMLYEPHGVSATKLVDCPREGGVNRIMTDSPLTITGLDHPSLRGMFDVVDSHQRRHRLQVRMEPSNGLVQKILKVCTFVLRDSDKAEDSVLACWWEVMNWLRTREGNENDLEWTAMVVVLFAMAVPFLDSEQIQAPVRARRKKCFLRSSSGSYSDLESWEMMLEQESGSTGVVPPWMVSSSWSWVVEQDAEDHDGESREDVRHGKKASKIDRLGSYWSTFRKNSYLVRCTALAREFLQSPQGAAASGPEGYLPTASCQNQDTRRTALCTILVGLHLLREERKLSVTEAEKSCEPMGLLAPVLAQVGGWLGWKSWSWTDNAYYAVELASIDRWAFENHQISSLDVPPEPFAPPSIFAFIEKACGQRSSPFLTLLDLLTMADDTQKGGKLWQECSALTPRTLALNGFLSEVHNASTFFQKIHLMHRWGLTRTIIETLPEGVSAPLYEVIMQSQMHASTSWDPALLELIDRDDLCMSMNKNTSQPSVPPPQPILSHDAVRDFHSIGNSALDIDAINSFEVSAEADRFSVTRLIFREDKRFVEATRLLNQSKAPVAECIPEPDWTDSDLLEAQKDIVQLVTLRTLSIPAGRGMLSFSGRLPLLTEKLPIPSFSLQCIMKPSNVTISADRSAFGEEKVCWAFFHNGVSTGLAISKASKGIETSWILFNKPQELTNRHAGFLLALGLNGHLKSLAKWVAFKYLTPKHTMTSIGLLLGLSASYLGTMDTLITRLLSVHVTRMLPVGAAELNLSPLTQTAGVMGIGLLYCGSQHRRMSEVMLSEIENVEQEESSMSREDMRDEGYRLAAGFALGLINLAKGKDLRGMRDMHIVERLLAIAVGTKNVDLAHILDRATAGATIALAIIFMKTNDEVLAQKIDIPDTTVRYDYVRPDLFLLRTLARHLIMWDSVRPSEEWFIRNLPNVYRRRYRLTSVRRLCSDDMPFYNIIAGLCFTLGLRFAGSAQAQARDILISYLGQFIRICKLPVVNYDMRLARNSARNCQDIVALSAAAVMAGTGDLALLRRLRSLHGRIDSDTPYGSHMAAHMAIGLLFLGGGSYTLGTSDLAVASLLCSLYPIFPTTVLDNKCHLQAFRHFWVLAAEPRCLIARDIDTRRPISVPIRVTMKNGVVRQATAPCLLPDLNGLAKVELQSTDHWPLVLDFGHNDHLRTKFGQGDQSVYIRRKAMYNLAESSAFASTFSGLSEAQDVLPSTSRLPVTLPTVSPQGVGAGTGIQSMNMNTTIWDWIFNLPSLQTLDIRERSLLRPPLPSRALVPLQNQISPTCAPWLRTSVVDSKLVLESTISDIMRTVRSGRAGDADAVRDRMWQLRLLFSWFDENHVSAGTSTGEQVGGLWLRDEFIEEARWKIWGAQIGDDSD